MIELISFDNLNDLSFIWEDEIFCKPSKLFVDTETKEAHL
jgi:hypothetical protein